MSRFKEPIFKNPLTVDESKHICCLVSDCHSLLARLQQKILECVEDESPLDILDEFFEAAIEIKNAISLEI